MTDFSFEQMPAKQPAPKVLLIDADASRHGGLGRRLRRRGVGFHAASTALQGMALARSIRPDVLVLGEALADAEGFELLRSIRRDRAFDAVPVLMLSARADAAAPTLALRAGANDILAPSIDAGELVERIQAHVRMAQAQRAATWGACEQLRTEERRLLAREVHDRLGQLLTAANIDIRLLERRAGEGKELPSREELLRELRAALSSIEQAIASVQDLSLLLRPPDLGAGGLVAALRWQAGEFQRRFALRCSVRHAEAGYVEPTCLVAAELFRICQEALTNVLRHAGATDIQVQLAVRGRNLVLRVCDNGVGLPRGVADAPTAIGIAGMRERAAGIHASLQIRGRPGRGTILAVRRELRLP
ncbi:response regulator [Massilia sp. LXY-6]|uniref:ATP-binding response regulator n=1 Tax=Massilia sp. LXY-6 TaxID=3379823 RepID=UPI003EE10B46